MRYIVLMLLLACNKYPGGTSGFSADAGFSLLRHIKSGELYGVPMSASPVAKNLYRLVGLRCSSKPFKL